MKDELTGSAIHTRRLAVVSRAAGAVAGLSSVVAFVDSANLLVGGIALFTLMAASTATLFALGKQGCKLDDLNDRVGRVGNGIDGMLPIFSNLAGGMLIGVAVVSSGLLALGASAVGVVALYGGFRSSKVWRTVDALERELEQKAASEKRVA